MPSYTIMAPALVGKRATRHDSVPVATLRWCKTCRSMHGLPCLAHHCYPLHSLRHAMQCKPLAPCHGLLRDNLKIRVAGLPGQSDEATSLLSGGSGPLTPQQSDVQGSVNYDRIASTSSDADSVSGAIGSNPGDANTEAWETAAVEWRPVQQPQEGGWR